MPHLNELSDESLAERVRAGDTAAYGQLWERHSGAARTAARSFASLADPDDLVSESFLQILRALQGGGGPREAFRPYLYRTIRNIALNRRQTDTPTSLELVPDLADGGDFENTIVESTVTARAFRTLPERWQTVLWYTEVEGMQPAEAAPALGLTPNAVAALAHRAREGLKKAWLQAHVSSSRVPPECQWTTQRMGDYARDALSEAARTRFEAHLESCTRCSILLEELDDLGRRLASVLLPIVLGGTAAATVLANSSSTTATASPGIGSSSRSNAAASASSARHGVLVAAAVVGVIALGGAAFALNGALTPPDPTSEAPTAARPQPVETEPTPDATAEPTSPEPASPEPTTTAPPMPPESVAPPINDDPQPPPAVTPPPPAPAPAPDVTPPRSTAIATPAQGSLGNNARPTIAGSGEPGARVDIERISGAGALGVILSTVVSATGQWTIVPTALFLDGPHTLRITQVDAAGNRSAPVPLDLTIDTVAAPPTVEPVSGPQQYLPILVGVAEPNALVDVVWANGVSIGSVTAAADGTWSIAVTDPGTADSAVTVTQTDLAGNRSADSAPLSIEMQRPEITVPEPEAVIPSAGGSTVVEVRFGGIPGERVEVLIDGVPTGNIHTLGSVPLIRSTAPLADGRHTIAVRYVDSVTGAVGSVVVVAFTVQ